LLLKELREKKILGLAAAGPSTLVFEKQQFTGVRIAHQFVDFCNW
jgi:hypothetical protein